MVWGYTKDTPEKQFAKAAEKAFNDPVWEKAAAFMAEIPSSAPEKIDSALDYLARSKQTDPRHRFYVLAQLGAERLAGVIQRGKANWGEGLNAMAGIGDAEELKKFLAAGRPHLSQHELDSGLRAAVAAAPYKSLVDKYNYDYRHYNFGDNAANAGVLLAAGANPNADNADLLMKAAEQKNLFLVKVLAEGGADLGLSGRRVMAKAAETGEEKIAVYLKGRLLESERFTMPDPQTLVETKRLDAHGAQLKLVFNFETKRVTEIFTGADDKHVAAISSHSFDAYDADSLMSAFNRLRQLGGQPNPLPEHKMVASGLRGNKTLH